MSDIKLLSVMGRLDQSLRELIRDCTAKGYATAEYETLLEELNGLFRQRNSLSTGGQQHPAPVEETPEYLKRELYIALHEITRLTGEKLALFSDETCFQAARMVRHGDVVNLPYIGSIFLEQTQNGPAISFNPHPDLLHPWPEKEAANA